MTRAHEQATTRGDDSLAPVAFERLSIEDKAELRQMGRGKAKTILLIAGVVALAVVGGKRLLHALDVEKTYSDAAAAAQAADKHADSFLLCALPAIPSAQLAAPERLQAAVSAEQSRLGRIWGRKLAQCTPHLADLPPALSSLQAPPDVAAEARALQGAAERVVSAWRAYVQRLTDLDRDTDLTQTAALSQEIGLSYQAYTQHRDAFDAALRAHD